MSGKVLRELGCSLTDSLEAAWLRGREAYLSELLKVALEFGLVTEFTMGIMRENIRSHATSKLTLFKITSTHFALFVRSVFFF